MKYSISRHISVLSVLLIGSLGNAADGVIVKPVDASNEAFLLQKISNKNETPDNRLSAVSEIEKIRDPQLIDNLLKIIPCKPTQATMVTVEILDFVRKNGDQSCVPKLERILHPDTDDIPTGKLQMLIEQAIKECKVRKSS